MAIVAIFGLLKAENPCPDGKNCEKLDRSPIGHWPKYRSPTSKLKQKIRQLEYELEQEKRKKSASAQENPGNSEELKNAKIQIEELKKDLDNERKNCAELQKSLDHAKLKIKNFLTNPKNQDFETKNEKMSKNLELAKMQVENLKKIVPQIQSR